MALKSFLANNAKLPENQKVVISNRFIGEDGKPEPFEIRAVTEDVNNKIREKATRMSPVKGKNEKIFNSNQYLSGLIVSSLTYPDLKDAELQKSYGVVGEAELLEKMLLPGEYADLLAAVQKINGYEKEDFEKAKEEVKNS